jgi:uncharacterized protein
MEEDDRFIEIDPRELSSDALRGLIEEFVTREGTEYGLREKSLEDKVRDVERQLASGEARIVYDSLEEQANIVPVRGRRDSEPSSRR